MSWIHRWVDLSFELFFCRRKEITDFTEAYVTDQHEIDITCIRCLVASHRAINKGEIDPLLERGEHDPDSTHRPDGDLKELLEGRVDGGFLIGLVIEAASFPMGGEDAGLGETLDLGLNGAATGTESTDDLPEEETTVGIEETEAEESGPGLRKKGVVEVHCTEIRYTKSTEKGYL